MALFTKLDDMFAPEIGVDQNRYTTIIEEAFDVIKAHTHASGDGQPPIVADGSITESKIATGAVTNAKLGESSVGASKLATDAVETAKIKDSAVTTTKVNDKAITNAKLADVSIVLSSDISYTLPLDINPHDLVSLNITSTTGRPIEIYLCKGQFFNTAAGGDADAHVFTLRLFRDATQVEVTNIGGTGRSYFPNSVIRFIDPSPTIGAHTYKIELTNGAAGTLTQWTFNGNLAAREL